MSNDFALNSGQSVMPFPARGLNGNGLEENIYYGFPFMESSQIFPGSAMMMNLNRMAMVNGMLQLRSCTDKSLISP
jgi:hypothetical protein